MARPAHEDVPSGQRPEVIEMTWSPTRYLLAGELDNSARGKIVGWMRFAGMKERVTLNLRGDFDPSIRGTKIRFSGSGNEDDILAESYMYGFATHQTRHAGDVIAGNEPCIEWFGDIDGRVVIELEPDKIEVIGQLLPLERWESLVERVNGQT